MMRFQNSFLSFNYVTFVTIPITIGTTDITAKNTGMTGTIASTAVEPNNL